MKRKELNSKQMLIINMMASAITYVVSFFTGLFLSPYIVKNVGVEAYGFVSLADSFVSYASLSGIALNALAGRFITIYYHKNDIEKTNRYYSSVFFANCVLSCVIFVILATVWINLESIISIPADILWDVKILFAALFINCIVTMVGSVFTVATFATNKLYIESCRTIESQAIRAFALLCLFSFFTPHVWYLGVTALITGIYCFGFNIRYMKLFLPELKLHKKYFDIKSVIELVKSGVWSLINQVGALLLDGLDLLITNIFIDSMSMGMLSLAKVIPSIIRGIIGSIANVFTPNLTIYYAQGKKEEFFSYLKQSMKIMGVLTNFPIIILVVCGKDFFRLWQPTQNAEQLQILSVLTISSFIINGGVNCLYSVFTILNKLKVNSIAMVLSGAISAFITFILVKNTTLGIFAVAGTSSVITVIRNLFISIPYAARCLDLEWTDFYKDVFRPILYFAVSVLIGSNICDIITVSNWLMLIVKSFVCGIISLLVGLFVILNKSDRRVLLSKVRR